MGLVDTVVDAAEVGIDIDVLDIGTGEGEAAILAARRGATVIGLDPDETRLTTAARQATEIGVPVDWMVGSVDDIPCPEESMDRIISVGGLDGADPTVAAGEIMRILRPGGTFVLTGGDEATLRAAFEPYGVEIAFEHLDGTVLTRGRRVRNWPV